MLTTRPTRPAMTADEVRSLLADGDYVVDVRPAADFAAGHIPSAISIPLRDQFASWLGWLLLHDVPIPGRPSAQRIRGGSRR